MSGYQIDFSIDPLVHFERLLSEALSHSILEYNAMSLATVDENGQPNVRIVYYKGLVRGGLSFYTNYQGQKGRELEQSKKVCVNFYWPQWNTQIRIQGEVEKLKREESEAYFKTRPRLSQVGAWTSHQSDPIQSFDEFKLKLQEKERSFVGQEIPCPPHWGGYMIKPSSFEFWFGREGRLHERYVYEKIGSKWKTYLRSP